MPRNRNLTAVLVAVTAALSLAACGITDTLQSVAATTNTSPATQDGTVTSTGSTAGIQSHAQADDVDYDAASAITVTLADAGTTASGAGVSVDGASVTITDPGTYVLTGTLSNGTVVVDSAAEGKVRLVLDDASVTNSAGAAINVVAADEVVVVLAEGSTNVVADGTGYDTSAEDAPNAALFSMADLTLGGTGSLTVTGNTNDGLASKDGLVILGGTITVTAVDDAIRGKDYVIVEDGVLDLTSEQDGLKSDNDTAGSLGGIEVHAGAITIKAGDDGIHAEGAVTISGGTVTVARATEGLEGSDITISGGEISVTSSDDGINGTTGTSTGGGGGGGGMGDDGSRVVISAGTLTINAEGDGLDSNGSLEISGGTTTVFGPSGNGNGSLDSNGGISVTGGTLIAAGSAGMAEAPEAGSSQSFVQANVSIRAGQEVQVRSGETVLASYTAAKGAANLVVSAPGLTAGQSYDIYVDGTKVGSATAGQATGGGMGGGGMGKRP
ncbi:MAG: carbohydrate-binding domain-containing protein [Phycicoccus sp.]|nr:carbohydrate-binding domain-containing protein [Phycicoccus sp.]